jgi:hypothetical protein
VRLQRGRDLIRGAGAPALPAEAFLDLCRSFGADGCQMDIAQLASTEAAYLDGIRRRLDEAGLFVELSVSGKALADEDRFAEVASVARRLGASRLQRRLLHAAAARGLPRPWPRGASSPTTGGVCSRARRRLDRHRSRGDREPRTGAPKSSSSSSARRQPTSGPASTSGTTWRCWKILDTAGRSRPTRSPRTSDMAVRLYERGFELSGGAAWHGHLSAAQMIESCAPRALSPAVPGDDHARPLKVRIATTATGEHLAATGAIDRFEAKSSRARAVATARLGLSLEAMQASEDETRLSTAFARATLRL